ncbi:MAG: hypothetical protein GC159_10030 [Phycisphaera sp.]|nr:hypothetical protein [Phycisphaera sp.]
MSRKFKQTRKSRRSKTRSPVNNLSQVTADAPRVHRFGELRIPADAQVRDSCYIQGQDVNESMDMWWNCEE